MTEVNTYRGFFLVRNEANPDQPTTVVAYIRVNGKYADAWKDGRKAAKGEAKVFSDRECKNVRPIPKTATFVACDDMTTKKTKLDPDALRAAISDPKTKPEEKIKLMQQLLGQA